MAIRRCVQKPDYRITKNAVQKKNGQLIKYARWCGVKRLRVQPATCTAKQSPPDIDDSLLCWGVQTHSVCRQYPS